MFWRHAIQIVKQASLRHMRDTIAVSLTHLTPCKIKVNLPSAELSTTQWRRGSWGYSSLDASETRKVWWFIKIPCFFKLKGFGWKRYVHLQRYHLKKKAATYPETLVAIYQVTYRHIPTSESLPWETPISVLPLSFKATISVLLKKALLSELWMTFCAVCDQT
jgi:hypothetical protein